MSMELEYGYFVLPQCMHGRFGLLIISCCDRILDLDATSGRARKETLILARTVLMELSLMFAILGINQVPKQFKLVCPAFGSEISLSGIQDRMFVA